MKKFFKHILSLALVALMAVSTIGSIAASAVQINTPDHKLKIYFENTQNWDAVYMRSWKSNGVGAEDLIGVNMGKPVGTINVDGKTVDVYSAVIDSNMDYISFSDGSSVAASTNADAIYVSDHCWCGSFSVSIDENNHAGVTHFFNEKDITPLNRAYFVNNKGWSNVSILIDGTDKKVPLEKVGTINYSDNKKYSAGKTYDVYSIPVDQYEKVRIAGTTDQNQSQTSDWNSPITKERCGNAPTIFSLEDNNGVHCVTAGNDGFNPDDIK